MTVSTVMACANIAFIKYWGYLPNSPFIPANESLSMTLDACYTITSACISDKAHHTIEMQNDQGEYVPLQPDSHKGSLAYQHLERLRLLAQSPHYLIVRTKNSFPADAGIASSASGFCALTGAGVYAYGLSQFYTDSRALSRLVRSSGSASAARSVFGGFTLLRTGATDQDAYAQKIDTPYPWDLIDVVAIVNSQKKSISSSHGHALTQTSSLFSARIQSIPDRMKHCLNALQTGDLALLGTQIEADTLSMHAVMMTSQPPIFYWEPGTIEVMRAITEARKEGLTAYFSIDAGANVHIIAPSRHKEELLNLLSSISSVKRTIVNHAGGAMVQSDTHLFSPHS